MENTTAVAKRSSSHPMHFLRRQWEHLTLQSVEKRDVLDRFDLRIESRLMGSVTGNHVD